ncbi:hypothetical protein [Mesorhizobium kowhaii]|nr:hypothetical protein [Mesorhizobium kowhaii]
MTTRILALTDALGSQDIVSIRGASPHSSTVSPSAGYSLASDGNTIIAI